SRRSQRLTAALLPAVLGGAATAVAAAVLERRPPGGHARFERTNFAGRTVSLLGGPAAAAGAVAGGLAAPLVTPAARRVALGAAIATGAAGVSGAVDDLGEAGRERKGLRGHLGALARGQVTTGALKIAGIGAGALAAAALASSSTDARRLGRVADTLLGGALIAATANLHNLFDLRPGRSLKVACLIGGPLAVASPGTPHGALAAGATGVAVAALPDDLREVTMLGDTGANAVGALVGTALAAHPSRAVRGLALTAAATLTVVSERISFSEVIASTDVLRRLDELGRRV